MRQCFVDQQYRVLEKDCKEGKKRKKKKEYPQKQHNTDCLRRQEMCLNESSSWLKLSLAASVSVCLRHSLACGDCHSHSLLFFVPTFFKMLHIFCFILKIYFKTFKWKRIGQYSFVHVMINGGWGVGWRG